MKPIRFTTADVRLPLGDDGIWSLILSFDEAQGTWSVSDLDGAANMDAGTIRDFVRRLLKAGRIARAGTRPARPPSHQQAVLYRLVIRSLETPRLRRDGTECPEPAIDRMWRVIRMVRSFSAGDIAEMTPVPAATAERYLRHLATGPEPILRVSSQKGGRAYVLVRDIGAKAPKVLRGHVLFDPNARQLVGPVRTEEVSL